MTRALDRVLAVPGRMQDETTYWALRAYARVLKAIGDASAFAANRKRAQPR